MILQRLLVEFFFSRDKASVCMMDLFHRQFLYFECFVSNCGFYFEPRGQYCVLMNVADFLVGLYLLILNLTLRPDCHIWSSDRRRVTWSCA